MAGLIVLEPLSDPRPSAPVQFPGSAARVPDDHSRALRESTSDAVLGYHDLRVFGVPIQRP